jgi:integrase
LNWLPELKSKALELLEQRIFEQFSGKKQSVLSLKDLIEKFQDLHFSNMSKANRSKHYQAFNNFLDKNLPLDSNIIRDYLNKKIINSELNPNSINRLLVIINRVFKFAVEENYLDKNPLLKAMVPKTHKTELKILTDKELKKALDYFKEKNIRMYYLTKFIRLTGMRINEAVTLKNSDIKDNMIIIHGKGNKDRQFTLKPFPELVKIINKVKSLPTADVSDRDRLFGYINSKTPQQHLRKAFRDLGIYDSGRLFHSIRKLRENELLYDLNIPDKIVAQMLGHTVQTQRRFYEEKLSAERQAELILSNKRAK